MSNWFKLYTFVKVMEPIVSNSSEDTASSLSHSISNLLARPWHQHNYHKWCTASSLVYFTSPRCRVASYTEMAHGQLVNPYIHTCTHYSHVMARKHWDLGTLSAKTALCPLPSLSLNQTVFCHSRTHSRIGGFVYKCSQLCTSHKSKVHRGTEIQFGIIMRKCVGEA